MLDSIKTTLKSLNAASVANDFQKLQQSLYRLSCFALENQQNRFDIVTGGGIKQLVLQMMSQNEYIQELALTCLLNLTLEERHKKLILYTPNVLPNLLSCCKESQNNDNRILACHCVQELANYNLEHCKSIVEEGGLKALVACASSLSLSLCRSAAKALSSLSVGQYKPKIVTAGALEPLTAMLCSNSSDTQLPAIVCLWELATCAENRSMIADCKVSDLKRGVEPYVNGHIPVERTGAVDHAVANNGDSLGSEIPHDAVRNNHHLGFFNEQGIALERRSSSTSISISSGSRRDSRQSNRRSFAGSDVNSIDDQHTSEFVSEENFEADIMSEADLGDGYTPTVALLVPGGMLVVEITLGGKSKGLVVGAYQPPVGGLEVDQLAVPCANVLANQSGGLLRSRFPLIYQTQKMDWR